jgi:hypothetical protein
MGIEDETNGWVVWGKHVLLDLKRQNDCILDLTTEISKLRTDLATVKTELKIKSGIWGIAGGALAVGIKLLTEL